MINIIYWSVHLWKFGQSKVSMFYHLTFSLPEHHSWPFCQIWLLSNFLGWEDHHRSFQRLTDLVQFLYKYKKYILTYNHILFETRYNIYVHCIYMTLAEKLQPLYGLGSSQQHLYWGFHQQYTHYLRLDLFLFPL